MARVRMVTRTIEVNNFEVMTLNTETAEVLVTEYTLVGSMDKCKDVLAKLKSVYDTDTIKLVHIRNQFVEEVLYGMPEEDFLRYAQRLPDDFRGVKHE